jgi:hypothetical protein
VPLAIRLSALDEKTLTFEVHLAGRTVEAFRMPVLVQCLNPSIARFDRELTTVTLGLEHQRPILWTIDGSVFIVEASGSNRLMAFAAEEAVHVEGVLQCVDHFANDGTAALAAFRCEVLFVVPFAVELTLFLDEPDVDEWHSACGISTDEVIRAPGLVQRRNERTSDGRSALIADGYPGSSDGGRQRPGISSLANLHLAGPGRHLRTPGGPARGR